MPSDTFVIAISQRVDTSNLFGERRDVLDQRWTSLLHRCGFEIAPMPNAGEGITAWLDHFSPAGVILSGGNDLAALGGHAPERDRTEAAAIDWATGEGKPLLGVCRGLQFLVHRTGGELEKAPGHAGTRHMVTGAFSGEVNSYHDWTIRSASADWLVLATSGDATIEAVRHRSLPHLGIMWHPERETPFRETDIRLIRDLFGAGA